jgi:hypothetical protein
MLQAFDIVDLTKSVATTTYPILGPFLPQAVFLHCVVEFDDYSFLVIGGKFEGNSSSKGIQQKAKFLE